MCLSLYSTSSYFLKVMGRFKLPGQQNAKVSLFRKQLLNRCQREFFRENSDKNNLEDEMKALHEKRKFPCFNNDYLSSGHLCIVNKHTLNPQSTVAYQSTIVFNSLVYSSKTPFQFFLTLSLS